jgi:hypothetical protein
MSTLWVPSSGSLHIFRSSAFQMVSSVQRSHTIALTVSAHTTISTI